MTNNSGEEIRAELPRCRLLYNWASLVYDKPEYEMIAAASSTLADSYMTGGLGLSTVEYNRLLVSC
jgi:hypothetical protein